MDCRHCGQKITFKMRFCPNCGQEIPRPTREQLEELKSAFDRIEARMTSAPDLSANGLNAIKAYTDLVIENLTSFGKLLLSFNDRHAHAQQQPHLFNNRKWQEEAKLLLAAMSLKSTSLNSTNLASNNAVFDYPEGCFSIALELNAIGVCMNEFVTLYEKFLFTGRQDDLNNAGQKIQEVSKRYGQALDEVEKVINQIANTKE